MGSQHIPLLNNLRFLPPCSSSSAYSTPARSERLIVLALLEYQYFPAKYPSSYRTFWRARSRVLSDAKEEPLALTSAVRSKQPCLLKTSHILILNTPQTVQILYRFGEEFWGGFGEDFQWLKKERELISSR